jgi:hypothetical protein
VIEDPVAVLLAVLDETLTCGSEDLPEVVNKGVYGVENAPLEDWVACCYDSRP